MPFNVAVENPGTWIVGNKTKDKVTHGFNVSGITSHGDSREVSVVRGIKDDLVSIRRFGSRNDLESVAM